MWQLATRGLTRLGPPPTLVSLGRGPDFLKLLLGDVGIALCPILTNGLPCFTDKSFLSKFQPKYTTAPCPLSTRPQAARGQKSYWGASNILLSKEISSSLRRRFSSLIVSIFPLTWPIWAS